MFVKLAAYLKSLQLFQVARPPLIFKLYLNIRLYLDRMVEINKAICCNGRQRERNL